MRTYARIILLLVVVCGVITWSACTDGYPGTTSVYVGYGYGGYGPGWGHGWGGYYPGYRPPPVIGPPVAVPY